MVRLIVINTRKFLAERVRKTASVRQCVSFVCQVIIVLSGNFSSHHTLYILHPKTGAADTDEEKASEGIAGEIAVDEGGAAEDHEDRRIHDDRRGL